MPASLKVVTKPSLSSFISVEPANKQCVYSWGWGGSHLTRIAEAEAISASGLIDREVGIIRRKRELWAQLQNLQRIERAGWGGFRACYQTPLHAHQSMPYIG